MICILRGNLNGSNLDNARTYLLEVDLEGDLISSHEYSFVGQNPTNGSHIIPFDNGFMITGYYELSPTFNAYFMRLDENFNPVIGKSVEIQSLDRTTPTFFNGEIFFASQSAVINPGPEREILFGKIDMNNPEIPEQCSYFSDLIIEKVNLENTFSATFTLTQNSVNNFTISPTNLNLPINNICECVDIETEVCDNNIDDDGDGLINCDDPDLQDSCCCFVPPILNLGVDFSFCENENTLLNAGNEFTSYTWQDGFQNQNYSVNSAGLYTVEVEDECGNIQTDSIEIGVLSAPFTLDTVMICETDTAFIFGNPQTESGNYTGNFFAENGCDSVHQTTLQVVEILQSFEETMICSGDSILIFGNFENIAGNYFQNLTSESGCDSIHTITLEIVPEITVDFQTLPTCENQDNGFVQAFVSGGIAPYKYLWETANQNTDTLSNLALGEYGLTIVDNFGCELTSIFTINSVDDQSLKIEVIPESCFDNQDGILQIVNANSSLNFSLDSINFDTTTTFGNR
ncbi:MAG: hypothetical protein ACI9XO_001692 [Paraglaciecola sp.]|jgi:hypothetical protein